MRRNNTLPYLLLGLCIFLGLASLAYAHYQSRLSNRYVTVKGLAEMPVTSNLGVWKIVSNQEGNSDKVLVSILQNHFDYIKKYLYQFGFSDNEIKLTGMDIRSNNYQGARTSFSGTLSITLTSDKVDAIHNAHQKSYQLYNQGIRINGDEWSSRPRYYFTDINGVKPELINQSTKAAKTSAQNFADNSGANVAGIKTARQGIITLIPASRVEENHEFYRKKIARVVSTMQYYIK